MAAKKTVSKKRTKPVKAGKRRPAVKKKAKPARKKTAAKTAPKKSKTPAKTARKSKATKASSTKKVTKPKAKKSVVKARRLSKPQLRKFREMLLAMRERLTGQIAKLQGESLRRDDSVNSAEDGTDAFDRMVALELADSEYNSLVSINEALVRIDEGTYGMCDECDGLIEEPRLKALPFVTMCIACKSNSEKGKAAPYRRFPAAP